VVEVECLLVALFGHPTCTDERPLLGVNSRPGPGEICATAIWVYLKSTRPTAAAYAPKATAASTC
jgi:hypothetical protein